MFDTGTIILIALVLAAGLSVAFVRWRNNLRPQTAATETSNTQTSIWRPRSFVAGLIALGLAGAAQYAIPTGQYGFATLAYGVATLLFISVMSPWIPATYITEPPTTAEPVVKPKQQSPRPIQASTSPRFAIFRTWRYYTLADILKGRQPDLPLDPTPPVDVPVTVTPIEEKTADTQSVIATAASVAEEPKTSSITTATEVSIAPASTPVPIATVTIDPSAVADGTVQIWSGLGRPQGLVVTPQGNVLVLDAGQKIVYCFNPQGKIMRTWSIPAIADLNDRRFGFSPDGKKLYLADIEHGQVYSITLNED